MNSNSAHSPRRLQCLMVLLNVMGAIKNAAREAASLSLILILLYHVAIAKYAMISGNIL